MKFLIDDLEIFFPYEYIYPEQYKYMKDIKKVLDKQGHCLLEMPSGTGKTISLLSVALAYGFKHNRKIIYCSRTVHEMEKTLLELQRLYNAGYKHLPFLGIGLTSRKNLCIHPSVSQLSGSAVDAKCRNLTASFMRDKHKIDSSVDTCDYYENLENDFKVLQGVYTLEELKQFGKLNSICPYYYSRKLLPMANIIVYSYHYLLDPKIAELVSRDLLKESIVIMDESHNIDSVCIEAMSIDIDKHCLEKSAESIITLTKHISKLKKADESKLKLEYEKLVTNLKKAQANDPTDIMANPILPLDVLNEAIPGNIRQAQHFIQFLKRFIEYLKTRMRVQHVIIEQPISFLYHVKEICLIDRKQLQFSAERLQSLIRTLELQDIDEYRHIMRLANFATLVSTYLKGFMIIFEPFENDKIELPDPIIHLSCLDASIAIKPVFNKFRNVILTSGTLSPLDMYPKLLQFTPILSQSYPMTQLRNSFCPMIITRGSDQVSISSRFEIRNDPSVVRNYGNLLIDMCKTVPDGLVCFFPSYLYMESIISDWSVMGIINKVLQHKLVFIETPDAAETSLALENYRTACNNGRGACLLSVARGKVSEGIDFDHNYGRAVILFGIPYQYTESRILKARLEYLRENYQIRENDFLGFDALRHAAQSAGRVLRGKTDYGLMVFADKRYSRNDKRDKLPMWISNGFTPGTINLSSDMGITIARKFFRTMAQPFDQKSQLGTTIWTGDNIKAYEESIANRE
eukprot:NODE_702_length_5024_cov_0.139898.p1 type:complete len:744 gc:universal NODE_702_length_5024_cov_0.139898:2594-363(-)